MIEFFEFLNTCSPYRTLTYLVFIVIISFSIFSGISEIIGKFIGSSNNYYYNGEEVSEVSVISDDETTNN